MIVSGEKTSTWRLFDDKDLQVGDNLTFTVTETGEVFGTAKIESVKFRTLGTLKEEDWIGHERFNSEKEMYDAYKEFYGDKVNADSELKIITFKFIPKS